MAARLVDRWAAKKVETLVALMVFWRAEKKEKKVCDEIAAIIQQDEEASLPQ